MYGVVLGLHLVVCLALVAVILVQSGKGGGLAGGAFGGATQTVFGGRGATDFVTRATIALGVTFFVTSLVLAILTANGGPGRSKSLIQEMAKKAQQSAPQQPGQQPTNRGALPPGSTTPAVPAPSTPAAPQSTPTPTPARGGK
jgi:preprotein translocase subunit SecG